MATAYRNKGDYHMTNAPSPPSSHPTTGCQWRRHGTYRIQGHSDLTACSGPEALPLPGWLPQAHLNQGIQGAEKHNSLILPMDLDCLWTNMGRKGSTEGKAATVSLKRTLGLMEEKLHHISSTGQKSAGPCSQPPPPIRYRICRLMTYGNLSHLISLSSSQ